MVNFSLLYKKRDIKGVLKFPNIHFSFCRNYSIFYKKNKLITKTLRNKIKITRIS